MPSNDSQGDHVEEQKKALPTTTPKNTTIKFYRSDRQLKANKAVLKATSTFFAEHFQAHPQGTTVTAPKPLRLGKNIEFEAVEMAIDIIHGNKVADKKLVANTIPLLLVATALEIRSLEKRVQKALAQQLTQQLSLLAGEVQILEVATALREFYGHVNLGGEEETEDDEIGNEVGAAIAGAVASACWKRFAALKKSEEFMALLRAVPRLAVDILASGAEEDEEEIGKLDGGLQLQDADGEAVPSHGDDVDGSWEVVEADQGQSGEGDEEAAILAEE